VRILLVQPSIAPPGGGNLVAAWMLQALRDEHRATLLSWEPPNLAACNRFFGTSLGAGDFELRLASRIARRVGALTPVPLALMKHGLLLRQARRGLDADFRGLGARRRRNRCGHTICHGVTRGAMESIRGINLVTSDDGNGA